jgi:hypothetical protein
MRVALTKDKTGANLPEGKWTPLREINVDADGPPRIGDNTQEILRRSAFRPLLLFIFSHLYLLLHGLALACPKLPKNGDLPKSPLPGSPGAIGRQHS